MSKLKERLRLLREATRPAGPPAEERGRLFKPKEGPLPEDRFRPTALVRGADGAPPPAEPVTVAGLIQCSISVEVKGKPLKPEKSAREHGLRIDAGNGLNLAAVEVLGFKRLLRFTAQSGFRQVVDSRVSEGRLAFVAQDGTQIVVTKAEPGDLQAVVSALRCGPTIAGVLQGRPEGLGVGPAHRRPRSVATPMAAGCAADQPPPGKRPRPGEGAEVGVLAASASSLAAPPALKDAGAGSLVAPLAAAPGLGQEPVPAVGRTSLCSLPLHVQNMLWDFEPSEGARRRMAESCTQLAGIFEERQTVFRLSQRARGVSLDPERIFNLLARHSFRTTLDLSGFAELPAGATVRLAEVLADGLGIHLRSLGLRGCKALGDVSIRRLLLVCPRLQSLDILEIPRLGSRALEAPLPELRILAAGTLGRQSVAERPRSGTEVNRGALTNISGVLGSSVAAPQKQRLLGNMQITSVLLNRLSQRPQPLAAPTASAEASAAGSGGAGVGEAAAGASTGGSAVASAHGPGGAPLTHAILPGCGEITTFPRLPQTLRHLDLRDANIQVPDTALGQWRPLAGCPDLTTLCLAGNALLSSMALHACIGSLPSTARLEVLDLSETNVQPQLTARLPQLQPALTHLRLANCLGVRNNCVATLLARLDCLEVLDVAGCPYLEEPFSVVASAAVAEAEGAARAQGKPPPRAAERKLRLLGVGRTEFAARLDATRRALMEVSPSAQALPSSLDFFDGYAELPPSLL